MLNANNIEIYDARRKSLDDRINALLPAAVNRYLTLSVWSGNDDMKKKLAHSTSMEIEMRCSQKRPLASGTVVKVRIVVDNFLIYKAEREAMIIRIN